MANRNTSPANQYLRGLIAKHQKSSHRQIARVAYKTHPELWTNVDACQTMVRYLRGAQGGRSRKYATHTDRENYKPTSGVLPLPKPLTHFNKWVAVCFDGPLRALVLSDIHLPYHDGTALEIALERGEQDKVNFILLNGDTFDFYGISRWEKDPRKRDFPGEIQIGKDFLAHLRSRFPKAKIVFKWGNHDERWDIHFKQKAPELLGIPEFELETIFQFDRLKIQSVKEMRPIKLGELHLIHGHEYRFPIANPVNAARGFFLRTGLSCIGGHLHQTSQHSQKRMDDHVVTCWSTGCLCDLHPDYAPLNQWNHGFARVDIDKNGAYDVRNLRIIHGKAY
jgi:predicted phosphodiesterase